MYFLGLLLDGVGIAYPEKKMSAYILQKEDVNILSKNDNLDSDTIY